MNDFVWAVQLTLDPQDSPDSTSASRPVLARPTSPTEGPEDVGGQDNSDYLDELAGCGDDDDSGEEDSDDESLCNKLCTYTQTQKEFMNQHWYHCHTCKMVEGIGVCTICAKVCHADHDVTYSKHGSFFCDCGDKEDGSCKAMTRRSPQQQQAGSTSNNRRSQAAGSQLSSFGLEAMLPR